MSGPVPSEQEVQFMKSRALQEPLDCICRPINHGSNGVASGTPSHVPPICWGIVFLNIPGSCQDAKTQLAALSNHGQRHCPTADWCVFWFSENDDTAVAFFSNQGVDVCYWNWAATLIPGRCRWEKHLPANSPLRIDLLLWSLLQHDPFV